jgi:hypothetical protein
MFRLPKNCLMSGKKEHSAQHIRKETSLNVRTTKGLPYLTVAIKSSLISYISDCNHTLKTLLELSVWV